jgi:DNA-binding response OmpR family regulator
MHILIAEDDPVSRRMLEVLLVKAGHQVEATNDGAAAWTALQRDDAAPLAVLDWMMPQLDGVEICRRLRAALARSTYVILLTARDRSEDLVAGLQAGANDYATKPFDAAELRARVQVGVRVAELQTALTERVRELEEALANVRQLQGLLPMCSYCKKIRDDSNYWSQVEEYISRRSEAQFSHGICPDCWDRVVKPQLEALPKKLEPS